MSIKAKMIGLGALVLVTILVVQGANFYILSLEKDLSTKIEEGNAENDLRQGKLLELQLELQRFITYLRAFKTNAMDVMIEKDRSEVEAKLMTEINSNSEFLEGEIKLLEGIAVTEAEKKLAEMVRADTEEVIEMVRERLPAMIREQSSKLAQIERHFSIIDNELEDMYDDIEESLLQLIEPANAVPSEQSGGINGSLKSGSIASNNELSETAEAILRTHEEMILLAMESIFDREKGKISDERLTELKQLSAQHARNVPEIVRLAQTPEEKELTGELALIIPKFQTKVTVELKRLIEEVIATVNTTARLFEDFDQELDADLTNIFGELDQFTTSVKKEMIDAQENLVTIKEDGEAEVASVQLVTLIGVGLFALAIVGIFFWVSRSILGGINVVRAHLDRYATGYIKPIDEMADQVKRLTSSKDECGQMIRSTESLRKYLQRNIDIAESIGRGNLDVTVQLASEEDMFGHAFQEMVRGLSEAIAQIHSAVNEISSGSNQLNSSSQILAQNATEQAASLEQITSSMTELGSQVNQNATNANQANELAGSANEAAVGGRDKMQNLSAEMANITRSAEEVQKVNKVIDDIAFQTNLLALNAAVEAARAGVHGKGFAVVAEEVRNLAARSAKAASETSELIEGVVRQIQTGNTAAEQTAEALQAIAEQVGQASSIVEEITTACREQADGVGQINQGLAQIDQATQQNTANSEETAAASEEMAQIGAQLQQIMSRFQISSRYMASQTTIREHLHNETSSKPAQKHESTFDGVQRGIELLDY